MKLFQQDSFIGGLDTELDPTKIPAQSYSMLVNGRIRRNVVEPSRKHTQITAPAGNYQGLYVAGSFVVLFISGAAYYADITQTPITFIPLNNFALMSTTVPRIYAEIVPATNNFFNRSGTPDLVDRAFNSSIASFQQALLVFDGVNQPQAIFPNGNVLTCGDYANWTQNNPEYVPVGVLPATQANKLFLASADRSRVLHSVSGRMTDFVINLDANGDKGGDADTVSTSVSFNAITAIKPLASGQVLVGTLYATYVLNLDYNNPIFGEPYLRPDTLFPVGVLNELSIIDILGDTAFITQTGIQSFNTVLQAQNESNNMPFGAKIRGLLNSPQEDTCTGSFDDYALFAVNTIYGHGVMVYDTIRGQFVSLDLSFGRVKQFSSTRLTGRERMFFITNDNAIYEAFASPLPNSTRLYLGEWTPGAANANSLVTNINISFTNVITPGQCRVTVYSNRVEQESTVFEFDRTSLPVSLPVPIPFVSQKDVQTITYQLKQSCRSYKFSALVEWNFDGSLCQASVDGSVETAANVELQPQTRIEEEEFAFVADTGYGDDINDGTLSIFPGATPFTPVTIEEGEYYIFNSNGNGPLVIGSTQVTNGTFKATQSHAVIDTSTGLITFSLRKITAVKNVIDTINTLRPTAIIGGGNHSYPNGSQLDVLMGMNPFKLPFHACAGVIEYNTLLGTYFFNNRQTPRYFSKEFNNVEFFFYNAGYTEYDAAHTKFTGEPDGIALGSVQATWLQARLAESTRPYKIVIVNAPPYTNDNIYYPGFLDLRLPFKAWGASAVFSGLSRNMERFVIDGFPYFICGAGGKGSMIFLDGTSDDSSFQSMIYDGFLYLFADPLRCRVQFRSSTNEVLDEYAIYA